MKKMHIHNNIIASLFLLSAGKKCPNIDTSDSVLKQRFEWSYNLESVIIRDGKISCMNLVIETTMIIKGVLSA